MSKKKELTFKEFMSRRDFIKRSALVAGTAALPFGMTLGFDSKAKAQSTPATFDFYISSSGSDTNPGTLSQPWAITSLSATTHNTNNVTNWRATAGKRVGFLPGTYDVSGIMYNDPVSGALQIIGGTPSATSYWASSNASGQYSARTATLDAKGASGLYGGNHSTGPGNWDGPIIAHTGRYPTSYATGYATIDGLRFTGFSYKGVRIGDGSYEGANEDIITNPVLVTNCEFFGGGFNAGDSVDNCDALWLDHNTYAITATNNWFHDTIGHTAGNGDHLNAVILWGFGQTAAGNATGTVIEYNTCVNAGNIYGKEGNISGTTIQYNYIDVSMLTGSAGIQDFTGYPITGLTATTLIQNNVVIVNGGGTAAFESLGGISTLSLTSGSWSTPVIIRNNTVINTSSTGALVGFTQVSASSAGVGAIQFYNNIYVNHGSGGSLNGWGNYRTNPQALSISNYNLIPSSGVTWLLSQNSSPSSTLATYTSLSAFSAGLAANGGISGAEANSVLGIPTFTGAGTYASLYQLASGSPGKNVGRTNGTTSGSATDMGAWGNGATQIGCNFTSGTSTTTTPNAPVLMSVT